ncbi:MAG: hypothetical protein GXP62_16945 [Oligoflexia bacterium]|nr:hypothetical protein [Oligoflexia bacterium]
MPESDLIDRPAVRQKLLSVLERKSLLLYGPRRVGKSTELDRLVANPPPGRRVIRIDLEGHLHYPIQELAQGARRHLVDAGLLQLDPTDGVESVQFAGFGLTLNEHEAEDPWRTLEGDLLRAVGRSGGLVLALDEVPWWLEAIETKLGAGQARAALAALRRLRQRTGLQEGLRMILTGSIGLNALAAELGASAELNDLEQAIMPPLDSAQGAALFESELTAFSLPCTPQAAQEATRLAGGSPHWIKRLASLCPTGASSAAKVEAAVEQLLTPMRRNEFRDEGREHFERRHRARMPALLAILESVSHVDKGAPKQGAINAAISALPELTHAQAMECVFLLMDEFYLRPGAADTLDWVNPLFRRWWLLYGNPNV